MYLCPQILSPLPLKICYSTLAGLREKQGSTNNKRSPSFYVIKYFSHKYTILLSFFSSNMTTLWHQVLVFQSHYQGQWQLQMVTLKEMELESGGDDGLRMGEGVKCVRRPPSLPPGPSQPPWPAWRGEYYEGKCDRRCPSPTSHASGNNPAYKVSTRATPQENSGETVKKKCQQESRLLSVMCKPKMCKYP